MDDRGTRSPRKPIDVRKAAKQTHDEGSPSTTAIQNQTGPRESVVQTESRG